MPTDDPEHQPDDPDGHGLQPHGAADLGAQSADGAQDAELAAAVGDGNRKGIDDAEQGDEHGHDHLNVAHAEPGVDGLHDVILDLVVEHDEHAAAVSQGGVDAGAAFPRAKRRA